MRSSVSCFWIAVVVLSSHIGSSWTFCATNLILFGIFQCLRWHDEEQEGKDFTNFLTQISSQCVLQLSGEKNGIPSRPHPSKWQQLPRNQISVTWFFLKMKRDCFYLSSWLGNYTPFFLFVTSSWHSVQSFLDCLQGFIGPHLGSCTITVPSVWPLTLLTGLDGLGPRHAVEWFSWCELVSVCLSVIPKLNVRGLE